MKQQASCSNKISCDSNASPLQNSVGLVFLAELEVHFESNRVEIQNGGAERNNGCQAEVKGERCPLAGPNARAFGPANPI